MKWKFSNIESLEEKNIIVTGGNSGLGYESCRHFVSKGANVIMASRNEQKATDAITTIKEDYPGAQIEFLELDLANMNKINLFAKTFKEKYDSLDVLLNNAGIMTVPYGKTDDGFELQNGVNHLGHFVLTAKLFDMLKQTPDARIVNISSIAHKGGKINFDNYLFENGGYNKIKSYSRSKLSNLLFTYELDRRLKDTDLDIKVLAAHPGVSKTNLGRHIGVRWIVDIFTSIFSQDASQGALPGIRAALDENAEGGDYYGPSGFMELKGDPVEVTPRKKALDETSAKKLWALSEKLTGVTFEIN